MLIAGSSGSRKTTLLNRFIANTEETMARNPRVVLIFYAHMQETYGRLKIQPRVLWSSSRAGLQMTWKRNRELQWLWTTSNPPIRKRWWLGLLKKLTIWIHRWYFWFRMCLIVHPLTAQSAWMPHILSCSRTRGTAPKWPTLTSRSSLVLMASWLKPTELWPEISLIHTLSSILTSQHRNTSACEIPFSLWAISRIVTPSSKFNDISYGVRSILCHSSICHEGEQKEIPLQGPPAGYQTSRPYTVRLSPSQTETGEADDRRSWAGSVKSHIGVFLQHPKGESQANIPAKEETLSL